MHLTHRWQRLIEEIVSRLNQNEDTVRERTSVLNIFTREVLLSTEMDQMNAPRNICLPAVQI